jgi:hypothetical protein
MTEQLVVGRFLMLNKPSVKVIKNKLERSLFQQ